MSFDQIQKLVSSLAKNIDNNEKLATPLLAAKLSKYSELYPSDQTLGSMSRVISKMASNNTLFIKKGELKELYTKLYSRNTKFAELFQDELGIVDQLSSPQVYQSDESFKTFEYKVEDPILSNALNSAFDSSIPLKTYSQVLGNQAKHSVYNTLDSWNLKPNKLEVSSGNDKFLVIKADYETPKGVTSFYVPIEIDNGKVTEPSIFMGNSGPLDLNNLNIKKYLSSSAGSKLTVNAVHILTALVKASSEDREISGAEIALTKLNAARQGKSEFFQNQVVGQAMLEDSVKEVELPKSDDFVSFESNLAKPSGIANFHFGDKVKIARDMVARELIGYGYKNPQISVLNSDKNTIFYGVSLNTGKVAFTVPVKINNGKIDKPSFMLCNGSVSAFDKEQINKLYVRNETDFKVAAATSPQFDLTASDLLNNIKQASAEGNYAKAEDALNILANSKNVQAYALGFETYLQSLQGKKTASEGTCGLMVKNSSSEHPICGHTGLPLHKTYQDKDGNCRPLYRKGMSDTYEGAIFNNSKIFG